MAPSCEPAFIVEPLADDALLLSLGGGINTAGLDRVSQLHRAACAQRPHWLRDLVPAYQSLGVHFDSSQIDADAVREWLLDLLRSTAIESLAAARPRVVEIPVVYGEDYGPDLAEAARRLKMAPEVLVQRHVAGDYRVAMIGFAPGFPYLAGLDPGLSLPRLATPRTLVPAGSVAIGGAQTGIYPQDSPGGWRLIGRTPLQLFDLRRVGPSLLMPGDRVRFRAISPDAFARLAGDAG